MLGLRREFVLAHDDVDPSALLVEQAPEVSCTWAHRLLDPDQLLLLESCVDPTTPVAERRREFAVAASSDDVLVIALPERTRRAITGLSPKSAAWPAWLALEELRMARATLEEAMGLLDVFKRAALMSAIHGDRAYVRVWLRSVGAY